MTTTSTSGPVAADIKKTPQARLASLDAFRGFTMFWLIGGNAFLSALCPLLPMAAAAAIRHQISHSPWEGLAYEDLIWPSFMLMVGTSIPFSWAARSKEVTYRRYLLHALKRAIVLFLLGSLRESMVLRSPMLIELSSALQPIAIAYLFGSLLAAASAKLQTTVAVLILCGYALLLALIPASGAAGNYQIDANLVRTVDLAVLGRAHAQGWGTVLSTVPTIATTIFGMLLGRLLLSNLSAGKKAFTMTVAGLAGIGLGLALSPIIPVIMKLWTTSYGILSAGWACLIFAGFYWVIDVCGYRRAAFPLIVIGANALAAYMMPMLLPTASIVGIFTKGVVHASGPSWGHAIATGSVLLVNWAILWWLFKRRIFLRP